MLLSLSIASMTASIWYSFAADGNLNSFSFFYLFKVLLPMYIT